MFTCMHACMHAYKHAYMHTYIHYITLHCIARTHAPTRTGSSPGQREVAGPSALPRPASSAPRIEGLLFGGHAPLSREGLEPPLPVRHTKLCTTLLRNPRNTRHKQILYSGRKDVHQTYDTYYAQSVYDTRHDQSSDVLTSWLRSPQCHSAASPGRRRISISKTLTPAIPPSPP